MDLRVHLWVYTWEGSCGVISHSLFVTFPLWNEILLVVFAYVILSFFFPQHDTSSPLMATQPSTETHWAVRVSEGTVP